MKKIIILLVLGVFSFSWTVKASNLSEEKKEKTEKTKMTPKSIYAKLFENAQKHTVKKGILTVHLYDNKIYLEVPTTLMGKTFLITSNVESSSDFALSDIKLSTPRQISINKTDSLVVFMEPKPNVRFDNQNAAQQKAFLLSQTASIYKSFPIEGYNADSTAVIFEATSYFSGDNKDLLDLKGKAYEDMLSISDFDVDSGNSYIEGIRAYDKSISVILTNTLNLSLSVMGMEITDKPKATLSLQASLTLLPEKEMLPRTANPYIGSGYVSYLDYTNDNCSKIGHYATRRNISEKPIIFYVDTLVQQSWQKAIIESAKGWNNVFKKIGIKTSIAIEPYKRDSTFHADDPLLNTISLSNGDRTGISEYNITDPRTGEILGSKMSIGRDFAATIRKKGVYQMADLDARFRTYYIPDDVVCEGLKAFMLKAFGQSLGLITNYAGSYAYTPSQLRSAEFTQKNGFTASIMDDVLYNYMAQPGDKEKGVALVIDKPGICDEFAIEYLYASIGDDTDSSLKKWVLAHQKDPRLFYGKAPLNMISDPRCQKNDLSNDPFASIDAKISHLKYIVNNSAKWFNDGDIPSTYKELFPDFVFLEFYNTLLPLTSYIGGVYLNEADANSELYSYKSVPRKLQQKALNKILSVCSNLKWLDANRNFLYLGGINTEMSDWTYKNGIPFQSLLFRLPRMDMSVAKSDAPYTQQDFLKDMEKFLFKEINEGKSPSDIKILQIGQYINGLIGLSPSLNAIKQKYLASSNSDGLTSSNKLLTGIYDFNYSLSMPMPEASMGPLTSISYYNKTDIDQICYGQLTNIRSKLFHAKTKEKKAITKGKYDFLIQMINRIM